MMMGMTMQMVAQVMIHGKPVRKNNSEFHRIISRESLFTYSHSKFKIDNEEEEGNEDESPSRKRSLSVVEREVDSLGELVQSSMAASPKAGTLVSPSPRVSCTHLTLVKTLPMEHFALIETVSDRHRHAATAFQPANSRNFLKTVNREIALLRENLPVGILVKGYEDRMVSMIYDLCFLSF